MLAIAAGLASTITPFRAQGNIFYDQGLWQSVINVVSTIPFDNDVSGSQTSYTAGGLTESGVHFSSSGLYVINSQPYHSSPFLYDGSGLLTIALPTGTTAIGMSLFSPTIANHLSLNATLASSGTVTDSFFRDAGSGVTFWGITSSDPISTITISSSIGWLGLDNFTIGAVPEPSTYVLIGFGSIILIAFHRLNRRPGLNP